MTAPLYHNNQAPKNKEVTENKGNKGLWFDRFYDQYDDENWEVLKPKNNDDRKGNSWWLTQYFHNKKVGNAQQLSHHALQQQKLAEDLQGNSLIFSADWHMVTGMGNPHPVENGFAWHPTLGVPYLTGAAVKGLVRTYIENYLDADKQEKQALLLNWFGSTDKDPQSDGYKTQTGNLIFFDALPVDPVQLVVDIMTPHMGKWYQEGAEKPNTPETVPADWHKPVPVTFLATKNISLQFSYALRQYPENTSTEQRAVIDLNDVKRVLTLVLQYLGAGGKTATGYGAMSLNEKIQTDMEEEAKATAKASALKELSEEALALYELRELLTKDQDNHLKQAGCQVTNTLASLLPTTLDWDKEYQRQAADLAEEIYQWHGWGPKKKRAQKKAVLDKLRE